MERSQLFDLMGELKLYGMKAAFDEVMATAVPYHMHHCLWAPIDDRRCLFVVCGLDPVRSAYKH